MAEFVNLTAAVCPDCGVGPGGEHTCFADSDPMDRVMKRMRDLVDVAAARLLDAARHNIWRPYTRRELADMAGLPLPYPSEMTSSHVSLAFFQLEDDGKCWTDNKLRACFYPRDWDDDHLARAALEREKKEEKSSSGSGLCGGTPDA